MSLSLLDIPQSSAIVSVSIIDTSLRTNNMSTDLFLGPPIEGMTLNTLAYSFLIEHGDEKLVFDLGFPVNWQEDFPPVVAETVQSLIHSGVEIHAEKYVSDILTDNGVSLDEITAAIWSHTHFDHIGNPALFLPSTDLIVGPDTLNFFGVGYPANETSPFRAEAFEGRTVTEIEFPENATRIGGFQSLDYFGDGTFFLLHAPGHEVGHLNGLARVSSDPESYILLGADSFHHSSQIRPSEGVELPDTVKLYKPPYYFPKCIGAETFYPIHPSSNLDNLPYWAENLTSPTVSPFTTIPDEAPFSRDAIIARDVISKIQRFDADERVLVVAAHDESLVGVVEIFPATANEWRSKGWKEKSRWRFVVDFATAIGIEPSEQRRHPRQIV